MDVHNTGQIQRFPENLAILPNQSFTMAQLILKDQKQSHIKKTGLQSNICQILIVRKMKITRIH